YYKRRGRLIPGPHSTTPAARDPITAPRVGSLAPRVGAPRRASGPRRAQPYGFPPAPPAGGFSTRRSATTTKSREWAPKKRPLVVMMPDTPTKRNPTE